jgi:DNA-binding response OmpR family regulator
VTSSFAAKATLCDEADFTSTANPNMPDLQSRKLHHGAQFGEFSLDFAKMELSRADQCVGLTLQEFKVLKFLVARPGVVVSRRKLIGSLWPKRKRSSDRTVDNCIARLRQKIEDDPDRPTFIRTVHGAGYKFVPQETLLRLSHSPGKRKSEGTWEA